LRILRYHWSIFPGMAERTKPGPDVRPSQRPLRASVADARQCRSFGILKSAGMGPRWDPRSRLSWSCPVRPWLFPGSRAICRLRVCP